MTLHVLQSVMTAVIMAAIRIICELLVLISVNTVKNCELYGMQIVTDEFSISRSGRWSTDCSCDLLVIQTFLTYDPEDLLAKIHTI